MKEAESQYCARFYAYSRTKGADALVIVTEWEQFRALDLNALKCAMVRLVVVDLRNICRPEEMTSLGVVDTHLGGTINSA
jgi:UDPglucose 6-dehydrogenase